MKPAPELYGSDCYSPSEIAERVEGIGVTKAGLPWVIQATLGVLAGAFIGLGATFSLVVAADPHLGFGASRILSGMVFSLGLILVVIAGAELFTGNNLLVMATVAGRIPARRFLQNLAVVYVANLAGAMGLAKVVALSGFTGIGEHAVARTVGRIAAAKCALPFDEALMRGVLCNVLVCLAVWLAMAGRSVTDKVLAVVPPVTAFVACGFEHSVANMFLIPLALFIDGAAAAPGAASTPASWSGFAGNLIPVTLGNLLGGAGFVGLTYWAVYRRGASTLQAATPPDRPPPGRR